MFEVENPGPPFVADAFSGAEFGPNVHQQIDSFSRRGSDDFIARLVYLFPESTARSTAGLQPTGWRNHRRPASGIC
ncbi:hypothetical protein [Caproicibacterium lactatifermentans]|uniref:hypothetical protein n=1 Tax=Caproicibacterium lactatifermentans TaxID=2666138 RepID=UPI00157A952A